ncbi:MAG TPA: DUF3570 domain-containing protein [Bdellovibrionales bacterium]|nr:DUF3570 domain-containing protein [Bdellovibrionales bacterium]
MSALTRLSLAVVLLLAASAARAKVDVSSLYRVYNDGVTKVESPHFDVSAKIMKDRGTISAGFAQDILTSASSDVKSYSTRSEISDKRTEFSGTFSMEVEDGQLGWSYIRSEENDYSSNIYAFAGTRDFFQKNTVLFMSFSYGEDRIWASRDPANKKPMTHETYSLALTQVIDQKSIVQLLYDFRVESGYLSSPYRKARQNTTCSAGGSGCVSPNDENHPLTRNRHSLAAKYNFFYSPMKLAFANTFRLYFDSWAVASGTIEERITRKLGSAFDIALNLRYYYQKEASFYQDKYDDLGPFHTGNKTLSNYDTLLVGVRPTINFSEKLQLYAKMEYYTVGYKNHTDVGVLSDPSDDKALKITATVYGVGFEGQF